MSETRAPYGEKPTYRASCKYRLVIGGEVENCQGELPTTADDALDAASQALEVVKQAAGPHKVSGLVLVVSLEV